MDKNYSASEQTKRELAGALKQMMEHKPLEKIKIQEITDLCGLKRQSFYYHFQDIYDLVEWCIVEDGKRVLEGNVTEDTWQQGLRNVVDYLQDNRAMILNGYRSVQRQGDILKLNLSRLVRPLMEGIFDAQPGCERIAPEDREMILKMFSFGIVELVLYWVGNGMKPDGNQLVDQIDRIFDGSMESLIQKCLKK